MPKPVTQYIVTCLAKFEIVIPSTVDLTHFSGDLHNDSRVVSEGDIFCAIIGHDQDGRQYIEQAISHGAKLVIVECTRVEEHGEVTISLLDKDVVMVKFYQLNQQLFTLTKFYYQMPQDHMSMIGITGTNGKTTTSQLLAQMLSLHDKACAIIGTNGAGGLENLSPIENTTPGACELHQLFSRFKDEKFSHVAMEVSSHALSQKRVQADLFDIALFTNLSRDHLDYHGTMASYGAAKKLIFTADKNQVAIVNFDDELVKEWLTSWPKEQVVWLYGRGEHISANKRFVSAKNINRHSHGVTFSLVSHLGSIEITSPLLGNFNIDNLLAAITVLLIEGVSVTDLPNLVQQVNGVAGRMEASRGVGLATAVVDYAHTPDALEKALQACRQHCSGELYVVFGCGGDRDRGKRPLMAEAAEKYADFLVVTNDNPRSEDERIIANDIVAGFTDPNSEKISVVLAREQAVLNTLTKAKAGDIVLLAGKGHEDYVVVPKHNDNGDIIGTQKLAYNERLIVKNFYKKCANLATSINKATL